MTVGLGDLLHPIEEVSFLLSQRLEFGVARRGGFDCRRVFGVFDFAGPVVAFIVGVRRGCKALGLFLDAL